MFDLFISTPISYPLSSKYSSVNQIKILFNHNRIILLDYAYFSWWSSFCSSGFSKMTVLFFVRIHIQQDIHLATWFLHSLWLLFSLHLYITLTPNTLHFSIQPLFPVHFYISTKLFKATLLPLNIFEYLLSSQINWKLRKLN